MPEQTDDLRGFRRQVNVRLDPSDDRNLRAIVEVTREEPSKLIRRLLLEEYGRKVLGLVEAEAREDQGQRE